MPMAHAALGNHVVGKMLYLGHITFQHRNLRAVVMTDMHMQRGDGEIVMMMLGGHQPARQFAFSCSYTYDRTAYPRRDSGDGGSG